ncbi:hypothetical protein SNE40_005800 [Patella caerulea]|uniref:Anticodon-binding domain-containing protein n=1 Tax=Patella caerulea TaxID=87958 RepID=A0AAN8K8V8_PATCE
MASRNLPQTMKQILVAHGFWLEKSCLHGQQNISIMNYGTPGTLLRRNIKKEWYDNVIGSDSNVFPVENNIISDLSEESSIDKRKFKLSCVNNGEMKHWFLRRNFTEDMLEHYIPSLNLVNGRLPFTLVQIGTIYDEDPHENPDALWNRIIEETIMAVQHYTAPSNMFQTLDQWIVNRLRWWKKFLSNPGELSTVEVKSESSDITMTKIQYRCPWGLETIETVCNMQDQLLQNLEMKNGISCKGKWMRKTVMPHVLHLQTSLEKSMMAILVDSFKEKEIFSTKSDKKQDPRYVLQLHTHLAPFKVALATSGNKTKEIRHLADHFLQELRQNGIMVLDVSDSNGQTSQFKRYDELGIPYTVIMNDQTLDTGVVGLRNRDTNLREQLHVSNISDKLIKYLRPI